MPLRAKSLARPDETIEFPGITVRQVDIGDLTVGRSDGRTDRDGTGLAVVHPRAAPRRRRTLKGLPGECELFTFVESDDPTSGTASGSAEVT